MDAQWISRSSFMLFSTPWPGDIYQSPHEPLEPAECVLALWIHRPLSGDEACQTGTREPTDSKASAASAHSAGPVPKYRLFYFGASIFRFFSDFWSIFFCLKKPLNFGPAQNGKKIQKYDLGAFLVPILITFWIPFGTNFLNISGFPENLYFATSPQRNAHFHVPNPLILRPNFRSNFDVFSGLVFGHPFFIIFPTWFPKTWFLDPPWNPAGSKMAPKIGQVAPKGAKKASVRLIVGGTWIDPAFP